MASQEAESNTQQELWPYTLPPLMPSSYPLQYSWAFLVAQLVKNLPAIRETWVRSLGWEERSPREGKGYPLWYSGLENSMDYTVTKSWTRLSDFHFHLPHLLSQGTVPPGCNHGYFIPEPALTITRLPHLCICVNITAQLSSEKPVCSGMSGHLRLPPQPPPFLR